MSAEKGSMYLDWSNLRDWTNLAPETDGLLGQVGGLIGRLGHGSRQPYQRYGQQVA